MNTYKNAALSFLAFAAIFSYGVVFANYELDIVGGLIIKSEIMTASDSVPRGRFKILDADTQQVLAGAKITLSMQFGDGNETNGRSWIRDTLTDKNGEAVIDLNPEGNFLQISKSGYHEAFIYKTITPRGEFAFNVDPQQYIEFSISLSRVKNEDKKELKSGRFIIHYYPEYERCANLGLIKLGVGYRKVKKMLGRDSANATTHFFFNTQIDQGSGDWTASAQGISTTCFPWTDNINLRQIRNMWNFAIPHELAHHFLWELPKPYWAEEGIAEYVSFKIRRQSMNCSSENLVPIENLRGENMPQYESAACVWELLEGKYPGILKRTLSKLDESAKNRDRRANETAFFVKEILREAASEETAKPLINFFIDNFHFSSKSLAL